MNEIELSLITVPIELDAISIMLREFESQTNIHVKLKEMTWGDAWSELVKVGLYRSGPDVSEIGSTWLSSLVGMNGLRPFSRSEVDSIGGEKMFISTAWNSTMILGDTQIHAMPFLVDPRLIYYRRDLFAQAGVDENKAFKSPQAFEEALNSLKQAGIETPLVIPTRKSRMTLHNAAAWVWGNGGHLLSPDGKRCTFHEPEALQGWEQYFRLGRHLPVHLHHLNDVDSDAQFWNGQAAVIFSGPWVLKAPTAPTDVLANTGVAFPPGIPFVGGSNLVVWQHTHKPREALALVKFLTSQAVQSTHLQRVGLLPANRQAFDNPPYTTDRRYQHMGEELQLGRSFRLISLWGLVEDRLNSTLAAVWDDLIDQPDKEIKVVVEDHLRYLAQQLDNTLKSR